MPFPYFDNISTDFTGTWSSPRKRKAPLSLEPTSVSSASASKSNKAPPPCPHTMTILRSTRQLATEKHQCHICLEDYFSTSADGEKTVPVKMACNHIFCRTCIETHLSSSITCPLPWCTMPLPLQPESCALCMSWQNDHASTPPLVVTVRATEMLGSIKTALHQLELDDDFYKLAKPVKNKLYKHIRDALRKYEWQFHSDTDLAELLDPFLLAIDPAAAHEHFTTALSSPAPDASIFPPREHDADDYEQGAEPWVAAFLRHWAIEYVKENGEVRGGWGAWDRKRGGGGEKEEGSWEWPYKSITAHRMGEDGMQYLVKWVGTRYWSSWVEGGMLGVEARRVYDVRNGVVGGEGAVGMERRSKRKRVC
ncbi:hypothetical protein NX059_005530 [Plenodomus lindquistii]|nr:hypothetical protein NX059_005530 [Plenodomus lindquistii]